MSLLSRNLRMRGSAAQSLAIISFTASSALVGLVVAQAALHAGALRAIPLDASALALTVAALTLGSLAFDSTRRLLNRESSAKQRSDIDELSGLPNRAHFDHMLDTEISRLRRHGGTASAVLIFDIDHFGEINERYGRDAANALLGLLGTRLRQTIRFQDTLARLGGDEFAIVMTGVETREDCRLLGRRLLQVLEQPFEIGEARIRLGISIGIALCPEDTWDRDALMRCADIALADAKSNGRGCFAFYQRSTADTQALARSDEDELRHAIHSDHLDVAYQPITSPDGEKLIGVEALVRWNHPRLGAMPLERLLPLTENRSVARMFDEWVLRRACADARGWTDIRVAINISRVQFRRNDFVDAVMHILNNASLEASCLELDINEDCLLDNPDAARINIRDLHGHGVRFALNDFGTGFTSLAALRRFAFDRIKLHPALIQASEAREGAASLLRPIIEHGRSLGLTVCAAQVETPQQREQAERFGVHEIQGPLVSPPLSAREIALICRNDRCMPPHLAYRRKRRNGCTVRGGANAPDLHRQA